MRESIATSADAVRGIVTVQLRDADTGRVVFEETGENFLSLQSLEVARWFQRMMWGWLNPVQATNADGSLPKEMPWFPADHLAYWNDSAAEDAATETTVMKEVVGWATRWPVGSPSGKRGVVNITESELTDVSSKWVFDWVTSQGNGTFQSVGWCKLDQTNAFPMAQFPDADRIIVTHSPTANHHSSLWWDSGASKWNLTHYDGSSPKVVSRGHTDGVSSVEATLGDWGAFNTTGALRGIAKIGTDYIACGGLSTTGTLRRHTSDGTTSWTKNLSGYFLHDLTYDGTYIWTAGSDGSIRRHDATNGDVDLTITPWGSPSQVLGIAYDSDDSNFWIHGTWNSRAAVVKVDNAGGFVGPVIGWNTSSQFETATSPWAGSNNANAGFSAYRSGYSFRMIDANQIDSLLEYRQGNSVVWGRSALALKAGELFTGQSANLSGTSITKVPMNTLGSRVRLSSAVTKTSSQSLKITYQFDFV